MKACFVLQGNNTKIAHAIAIELKKNHGYTDFCGYIFSTFAKEFIEKQTDIKYNALLTDHELHSGYEKIEVDFNFLKKFENEYGSPNLWALIYGDRQLILSTPPKDETTMEVDTAYSYEDLLKIFISRAKPIEKFLDEQKPKFIFFFTVGTVAHKILFHMAKKKGIKTFVVHESRMGERVTVSESYKTITGTEELFRNNQLIADENIKKAKEIIKTFRETGSLNLEFYTKTEQRFIKEKRSTFDKIKKSLGWFYQLNKNYQKNKGLFLYGMTSLNPIRFYWYRLLRKTRDIIGFEKFYSTPKTDEKYAFYPLHLEPEQAILDYAPYYINQTALIEQIARSLPIEMKLYIKDHPVMENARSMNFYKRLLQIPNVRIIDCKTKSYGVIKNSALIITTTSTVGWEALFLNKPVITFGDVFYNVFPSVKKCTEIEGLYRLVLEQLNKFQHDEELFVKLVAAGLQDSTNFNLNSLWFEEFEKTKEDEGLKNFATLIARKV